MTWYAAHLLFHVKLKRKRQNRYPVWENIVLIKARTVDEAFAKAEKRGWDDPCMEPDDTFTWGGVPAEWVFDGVRKLTTCVDPAKRPGDGTEVSYLEMEVASEEALRRLADGDPVRVELADGFPDEVDNEVVAGARNGRRQS